MSQDNVKPVVDQIYEYVIGAKVSLRISLCQSFRPPSDTSQNKAQAKAADLVDEAGNSDLGAQAKDSANKAADKAGKATDKARKEAGNAVDQAQGQ